jgi:hypothetical protein
VLPPGLPHPSKTRAKKRVIATHPKLEIALTASNQRARQFLIATNNDDPTSIGILPVPSGAEGSDQRESKDLSLPLFLVLFPFALHDSLAPRGPRVAVGISRCARYDLRITANLIANGILERFATRSKQITGTLSNREKYGLLQITLQGPALRLPNGSPITALTTPSLELPSLRTPSLCYSHRVPPIGLRAIAPARPRVCGSLPQFPAEEVILCAF